MLSTTWLGATTRQSELSRMYEECLADRSRNFTLEDVHVEGTERIVEAVAKYDVDRYIHVSSYNADPNSTSEFFSTKVGSLRHISKRT